MHVVRVEVLLYLNDESASNVQYTFANITDWIVTVFQSFKSSGCYMYCLMFLYVSP